MNAIRKRVQLEPALEAMAGDLGAAQCRRAAAVFQRWARELEVKARILERDALPRPPPRLSWLPLRRARRN